MKIKLKSLGFIHVLALVVVSLVILVAVYLSKGNRPQTSDSNLDIQSAENVSNDISRPMPTPFEELTIPYLRSREYNSALGELENIDSNASYTSYLTSYDSDDLKINALLTIPSAEKPSSGYPAIVFVHGYIPPSLYSTTENYESYVDYFARNGFVVFKIDLRGHGDSQGVPGGAYYSGDYIIDTLNARAALKNADFVNSQAIGLWGHSMGGNVVFRSFVAAADIPAVVIWAGAVYTYEDFADYRISDNSYRPPQQDSERRRRRQELFDTHGEFNPESDFWRQVVPVNYLDEVGGQVQVHHAADDSVVDIGYSRNLEEILKDTDITASFYEYSSGGHNLTGASFSQAMQRSVEFFQANLSK